VKPSSRARLGLLTVRARRHALSKILNRNYRSEDPEQSRWALASPHALEAHLHAYLDGTGVAGDPKGPLFRTIARGTGKLSATLLPRANTYAMVRRRAAAAGIATKIGNHTFRPTGIIAGGTIENAATMANRRNQPRFQHMNCCWR
jgi:hypothetical protein